VKSVGIALLLLLIAGLAFAAGDTPASTDHRDNAAPCYGWPAVDFDRDGVLDRVDQQANTPFGCVVDKYGILIDSDGDGVCDGLDKCADSPKGEKVNKEGCTPSQLDALRTPTPPPAPPPAQEIPRPATPPPPPSPPQSETERQLVETGSIVLQDVYFETNKATILPESEARLNEAGAALEKFGELKVEVQGHTDSRGSAPYNLKLSQARAEAVRQYLLDHYHLAVDNYVAKGYGETQLVVSPEKSDEDLAKNRRVVLKVLNPDVLPHGVKVEGQQ
jgi:OmpA-OmpF porin, OOP family